MKTKTESDEYLELIWYMRENGSSSLESLKRELGTHYREGLVQELAKSRMIEVSGDTVSLAEAGIAYTRQLIRSHRIAERLVHDVLGVPYEEGACEFEHIVNPELVDSICTLLGHPRECPHGMPIPEGECCRARARSVESSIVPLTRLSVGESAPIAYVNAKNDQQMHKLENLQLSPGNVVRLHQTSPSFVIECENSMIALDEQVAGAIQVWGARPRPIPHHGRKRRRGFRHGMGQ